LSRCAIPLGLLSFLQQASAISPATPPETWDPVVASVLAKWVGLGAVIAYCIALIVCFRLFLGLIALSTSFGIYFVESLADHVDCLPAFPTLRSSNA
jgi:hypothetical protein